MTEQSMSIAKQNKQKFNSTKCQINQIQPKAGRVIHINVIERVENILIEHLIGEKIQLF